jgi:hypothetical protein
MSPPDLAVLAEGGLPGGPRWVLRAGGTSSDFDTLLEVIHSDGRRDGGGLGGQPLSPGSLMNAFAGYASATETRQVLVRADPRVARVRVHYISGEQPCLLDLPPVAARADLGLVFFAAVLPPCCRRPPPWPHSRRSTFTGRCWNKRTFPQPRMALPVACRSTPNAQGLPMPAKSRCLRKVLAVVTGEETTIPGGAARCLG